MDPRLAHLSHCNTLFIEDSDAFIDAAVALFEMVLGPITVARTLDEAAAALAQQTFDLIISDINIGADSALPFIADVRAREKDTPIIIISGMKDESLLLEAMTLNLSGYLVKPIQMRQWTEALCRASDRLMQAGRLRVPLKNGFSYDRSNYRVIGADGRIYRLNKREIRFFELLADNLDNVITRYMFAIQVWQSDEMTDSALNNFILRLRKRFGRDFMVTVADIGYRLQA